MQSCHITERQPFQSPEEAEAETGPELGSACFSFGSSGMPLSSAFFSSDKEDEVEDEVELDAADISSSGSAIGSLDGALSGSADGGCDSLVRR